MNRHQKMIALLYVLVAGSFATPVNSNTKHATTDITADIIVPHTHELVYRQLSHPARIGRDKGASNMSGAFANLDVEVGKEECVETIRFLD